MSRRLPSGLAWVLDGELRTAPLLPLPGLLIERGLDAEAVIREAGSDIRLFDDPDGTISFRDLGHLVSHCARVTRCPALGLEIGRRAGMDAIGAVGKAARAAPDLGSALRTIVLYLHLLDRGAVPTLRQRGEQVSMGYVLHVSDVPGVEYIYDGALAIIQTVLSALAGPDWRAAEVRFHRQPPRDVAPYRELFRTRLHFARVHSELVFAASSLARPVASADPRAFAAAITELDELVQLAGAGYAERVRRLLRRVLIEDEDPECARLCHIAGLLAVHPRTLNRRLRAEGTSFQQLVSQTRLEIARQLLRDTQLPLIDVASALGYGDASAFIRAFRRAAGVSPAAWRSQTCVV